MIDPYTIRYGALRLSSVTLPKDAQLVGDVLTFEQLGEYYMYYDVGATSAKPNAYTKILAEANKSIKIWLLINNRVKGTGTELYPKSWTQPLLFI